MFGKELGVRCHMAYFLLKTEPSVYSYSTLEHTRRTVWDGVANPTALRNLRAAEVGDEVLIYHTGEEKAAVGRARVVKNAYPDPKAKSDEKSRALVIDIEAAGALAKPVTLAKIKQSDLFAESPLVTQGRLSVVPLTAAQWKAILEWGAA